MGTQYDLAERPPQRLVVQVTLDRENCSDSGSRHWGTATGHREAVRLDTFEFLRQRRDLDVGGIKSVIIPACHTPSMRISKADEARAR